MPVILTLIIHEGAKFGTLKTTCVQYNGCDLFLTLNKIIRAWDREQYLKEGSEGRLEIIVYLFWCEKDHPSYWYLNSTSLVLLEVEDVNR